MIAIVALELSRVGAPPGIHFGWSDENPLSASIGFFLFGEGNVPLRVRDLIRKAQPDVERQPKVIFGPTGPLAVAVPPSYYRRAGTVDRGRVVLTVPALLP